jgi:hypothetical protein
MLGLQYSKVVEPSREISILGMIVNEHGWRVDPANQEKLMNIKIADKDSLRAALGLVQYLQPTYPSTDFNHNLAVLNDLLKKRNVFRWEEKHDKAWSFFQSQFDMGYYSFGVHETLSENQYWVLQTDASDIGCSVVLWKVKGPIPSTDIRTFLARPPQQRCCVKQYLFSEEERRYPVWDRESLAVYIGLSHFHDLLLTTLPDDAIGKIVVATDSSATQGRWRNLIQGKEFHDCGSRARRWKRWYDDLCELLETRPIFLHLPGGENGIADLFSRVFPSPCVLTGGMGASASASASSRSGSTVTVVDSVSVEQENSVTVVDSIEDLGTLVTVVDSIEDLGTLVNFDFSGLLNDIRILQSSDSNEEKYSGIYLRSLTKEIPEQLTSFTIVDGLLYFRERLYVPPGKVILDGKLIEIRKLLLSLVHDSTHCGKTRTIIGLKKYWWPRLERGVADYVKTCHLCQLQKARSGLYQRFSGRNLMNRFDSIILDHTKVSVESEEGYKYILTIMDEYSRYAKFYACKSLDSSESMRHLQDWFSTFGIPRRIISDNHNSFINEIWKTTFGLLKVDHILPPVYYPQTQGQVETNNSTIKSFVNNIGRSWPDRLFLLNLVHNSVPIQGSQITASELAIGCVPKSLVDLLTWDMDNVPGLSNDEYYQQLKNHIHEAQLYHTTRIEELRQKSRDVANLPQTFHRFKVGDEVIYVTTGAIGRTVHGVFRIDEIKNSAGTIFKLSNGNNVSISQVVPYHRDLETRWRRLPEVQQSTSPELGHMVLVKRTDGLIDIGKVLIIEHDIGLINYIPYSYANNKWVPVENLQQTCPQTDVIVSGFKLTKHGQLRRKDRIKFRSLGLDI